MAFEGRKERDDRRTSILDGLEWVSKHKPEGDTEIRDPFACVGVGLHWLFACWYKFWLVFWTEYKCNLFYEARFKYKEELACFSAVEYCIPLERHNLMWRIRWSWVLKHFSSEHCSSTELLCKGKIWILRSGKGTMTIFRNRGWRNAVSGRNKCWYVWLSICTIRFSLPISSVYGFSHLNPDVSAAKE